MSSPSSISLDKLSLYQFFGPGGLLSRTHPQYEFRRGQLNMATGVEEALEQKRHLIVEAGTGTGKTLAYLVPVLRSGKRVIISTGTKNLQEQLFFKDVPFLEKALFGESKLGEASTDGQPRLRVCYMKGRGNYLCRQKLYELADQPILTGLEEINEFRAISEWDKTTTTGDRAELSGLPETSQLWQRLDARTDRCIGSKCANFERCFITEMHRRAVESDIIIVNHHLFFADLAIKQQHADAGILPDAAAVIFDEAHELEDVAGSYFGVAVGNLRVEELARDVEITLREKAIAAPGVPLLVQRLRDRSQLFFSILPTGDGRFAFQNRQDFLEENGDEFIAVTNALTQLASELNAISGKPDEVFNLIRRSEEIRVQLQFVMESNDRNTVYWIERRGGAGFRGKQNVFLQATPIDVSAILRRTLFDNFDAIVMTSATLAVSGGFEYIRQRLGFENARELVVPSHFDYESQALLYVPPDLPDPRESGYAEAASQRIRQLLEMSRGRAFCLFTSYSQMQQVYDRLLGELDYPMLLQGSAPKTALLEEFRATPNAVLFATSSFWQGVDVQGEQLSCVIIDRLPFAVPSDPVVAARVRAVDDAGGNAFFQYQVPAAVIALKQGFGRLIRSLHDRGLLALLDNRILKKQYGRVFVSSLPPYRRTTDIRQVAEFFGCE